MHRPTNRTIASAALATLLAACGGADTKTADTRAEGADLQVAALGTAQTTAQTKDWTVAMYDAVASGHNTQEQALTRESVGQLEVKWRFDASAAGHEVGPIHATPVAAGNKIFVGSNLGRFYALSREGELLWEYLPLQPNPFLGSIVVPSPIGSSIEAVATPVVGAAVLPRGGNAVIFGDLDGNLYALNRNTGEELWVKQGVDAHPLGGVVGNSLLVVGDTLYVGFSSIENLGPVFAAFGYPCCSHRGFVAAFDVRSGDEKWRTYTIEAPGPVPEPYQLGPSGADIWGQPTYDGETNTLYVGTGQNFSPTLAGGGSGMSDSVIALDADTGAIKWTYQATENDLWTVNLPSPDSSGTYYDQDFGDSPKIYELDGIGKVIGLGQKSGEFHLLDAATGDLLVRSAHVGMANPLGGFQNLGAMANGKQFQHGLSRIGPPGSPYFNGIVMALSNDGVTELWRHEELFAPLAGGLAVANDVVYVVSPGAFPGLGLPEESALVALDADSGEVLNRIVLEGRALSSPVISRGRIYLGEGNTAVAELGVDESGGIVALGLPGDEDD